MKHNLIASTYGAMDVFSIVIDVAIVLALYPAITSFISTAKANMSATEVLIVGLIPLVLILALVYMVGKQTGLIKGGRK